MMRDFFKPIYLKRPFMIMKFPRLLLLLLLVTSFPLWGQSLQYENQQIEQIDIQINSAASAGELNEDLVRSRMNTREGDFFSQTEFDNDLKRLVLEFDRIEPTLDSVNGKMIIILKLWPKPVIRMLRWEGNSREELTTLQKELGIRPGMVFDRQAFNRAFHKVKAHYIKKGYFEAELNYEVTPDENCNEVDVEISINEGRAGKIKDIEFCGLCSEEENDILEFMLTKEYFFLMSWFTNEGIYNEDMIQQDQMNIVNYLHDKGYADARVNVLVEESSKCDRIIIKIVVEKGPMYFFGPINFKGNCLYGDEIIWDRLAIWEGLPYSPDKIRESIKNITDLYGRRGYIDCVVDVDLSLSYEERCYTANIVIEEGSQYRIGLIKVFGNCTTQTKVILHETLLVPGEIFNIEKLQKTEDRLKNIGFFKNVNVYFVKSEGPLGLGDCYRDVHVEVEETSTGNFGAFAGFSTTENIFGGINVTERNFNSEGLSTCWNDGCSVLRGGGEYVYATATIGATTRKYVFSWTKPYFRDTQWAVGFDIERSFNNNVSKDYAFDTLGYLLHATYQVNQFVKFGWHYRIKNTIVELDSKAEHNAQIRREADTSGLISGSGITLYYDSTDNPSNPREGFKSRLDIEYVGLGGIHTYFGLAYINQYFVPIGKNGVIKYRADFRFLNPVGHTTATTIPIDERLFLGGDSSIRGYRSYRIGPRFVDSDDPSGGLSSQLYSVEYAHRYNKRVEPFLFFDAGHLTADKWEFAVPRAAIGFGARVKVLDSIPALTIGMGYPLNAHGNQEVKRFFINVGGKF